MDARPGLQARFRFTNTFRTNLHDYTTTSSASSNGVKIRINGTQQQLQHSYGFDTTNYAGNGSNTVDTQTSLDFDPRRYESGPPTQQQQQQTPSKPAKNDKRKLTLEELEVAGATSDDSASSHGGMASSMDDEVLSLSSLIEGDVDAVDSDVDVSKTGLEDTEEPELLAISNNDDEARSEGKRDTVTEKFFSLTAAAAADVLHFPTPQKSDMGWGIMNDGLNCMLYCTVGKFALLVIPAELGRCIFQISIISSFTCF